VSAYNIVISGSNLMKLSRRRGTMQV